jgi:hypothetical protein
MGVVLLGIVEREALFQVFACRRILSQEMPDRSQHKMGPQEIYRVWDVLGQGEEFFPQRSRGL